MVSEPSGNQSSSEGLMVRQGTLARANLRSARPRGFDAAAAFLALPLLRLPLLVVPALLPVALSHHEDIPGVINVSWVVNLMEGWCICRNGRL